jgi:hypothetical protein
MAARGDRGGGHAYVLGHRLVAVDAADFLDQVDLAGQVAAPARRRDDDALGAVLLEVQAELLKDAAGLAGVDIDAENAPQLREPQGDASGWLGPRSGVDDPFGQLAAGQFEDQLARTAAGPLDALRIDAALEAVRRLAGQRQRAARVADREGVELGALDQEVGRGGRDFGLETTHHTADGHGPFGVGDDAHLGSQLVLALVDGDDLLTRLAAADDDAPLGELVEVEGVQRLAAFQQHVVGDVDDVVDRWHAQRRQTPLHPIGAGGDLDAANEAGGIARTEFGAFQGDAGERVDRGRSGFRGGRRKVQFAVEQDGHFAGDAEVAQAIGTVRGDLEIDGQVALAILGRFVIQARHHEPVRQLVARHIEADVLFEPIPGDNHRGPVLFEVAGKPPE